VRVVLRNLGRIVTGDVTRPSADGDTVVCDDGRIEYVGDAPPGSEADVVIDARGGTVVPGLIDSHVHVAFGDYTPRQQTVGYLASYVHGGVTTSISASEVHVPGRPVDPDGIVALAIAAHKSYERIRPGGMRVHGGSLILDPSLSDEHLRRAREAGVWLVKAGFGAVASPRDYVPLVAAARDLHMVTTLHTGGASIPGSLPVTGDDVLAIRPDVAFHCNGGPTAMSDGDYAKVLDEGTTRLQICTAGNLRTALHVAREVTRRDEVHRVVLGTDTPTGSGIMPLGMWYTISHLCSLAGVDPMIAIGWATGNNAHAYGLSTGTITVGAAADLVVIDAPLGGSTNDALAGLVNGDVPGIGAVVTDGVPRFVGRSRNSPPPTRAPVVDANRILQNFDGSS